MPPVPTAPSSSSRWLRPFTILFVLLAVFAAVDRLGDRRLANPDEGRYSEISREMAASGDVVTPRLNDLKYLEKPPLQYWATAAAFRLLGETEFAARFYTTLCGLMTILLVAYAGRRLWDEETGLIAGLVLLSAPYFTFLTEVVTLDMGLTFWTTLALVSLAIAQSGATRAPRRWMLAAWAGVAGAVLSKGLIGLVIPAAGVGLHCLARRDFSLLARLEWLRGAVLFLLITLPWFVAVSWANPEFPRFFFIHEHVERFLTPSHRRTEPAWYFLPILAVGFIPWIAALPAAWWRALRKTGDGVRPETLFALTAAFVIAFFSASSSKLPAYILPAFPLLALVLGAGLREAGGRHRAWFVLPLALLAVTLLAMAALGWGVRPQHKPLLALVGPWIAWAAVAWLAAAAGAGLALWRGRTGVAAVALAAGTLVAAECIERGYEHLSPQQSGHAAASAMRPHLASATRIYAVEIYDQSLVFYLKRPVTLVQYRDEFDLGLSAEPAKGLPDVRAFITAWLAPGPVMAIILPQHIQKFRDWQLDFEIVHQDPRRVVIRKLSP